MSQELEAQGGSIHDHLITSDTVELSTLSPAQKKDMARAVLTQRKLLDNQIDEIESELGTWERRIELAKEKQALDLAAEAEAHLESKRAKLHQLKVERQELEVTMEGLVGSIQAPSGEEVDRSANLLAALETLTGQSGEDALKDQSMEKLSLEDKLAQLKAKVKPDDPNQG